jgi:putative inorganic carbon (HCO3(-)) transporter
MLRSFFVIVLVSIGGYFALQTPFYALLFYIGNAYFRPEDWVWWNFVSSLKLSLISGAYVVIISLLTRQRFVWNGRIALLWLFLLHTFLSAVASEDFSYSWGYWTDFLKTIVLTYMIIVLVTDFSKFRLMVLVMTLALGLEQAKQGWFYLVTSPSWHNENPVAFLGDNNGVAVGMLSLLGFIGLLRQTTENKGAKGLYSVLFIGCLYRALSTHSRGAFIAAIVIGSVWWMRSRHKLAALMCVLTIIVIVLPNLPDSFWSRMGTIQTYEEVEDRSALGRLHFWAVAVEMANAHPWLGVGYFGYNPAYNRYDFADGVFGRWRAVHSSYFGVLAELGYAGAILYFMIIFGAMRSCSRVYKRAAHNPALLELSKSALALQISLTAFLVGGIFVSVQYTEMLWHIIGLTIVLERITAQRQAEISTGRPSDKLTYAVSNRRDAAA